MEKLLREGERLDEVNFRLQLIQKINGMTFGTDALLLASFVRPYPNGQAIEFGSGSGIISLLCASRGKFNHITAVEIQEEYVDLTKRNIAMNELTNAISVSHADIRDTKAYLPNQTVHAIFSNPPYMTVSSGYKASDGGRQAARHEVNGTIFQFCEAAAKKLRYGGSFYVVWRPDRLTDLIVALREAKLEPKRMTFVAKSVEYAPSIVLVEARLGGKSGLITTPIFYLQNTDGTNTNELENLLLDGAFPFSGKEKV